MPFPLELANGEKFAILAIANIGSEALTPEVLSDTTAIEPGFPVDLVDEFWQKSLGTIAVEELWRCNLLLLRRAPSQNPGLLDDEHEELAKRAVEVFWLLQLWGVPHYEGAVVLKGSVANDRIDVRAHENLSGHQSSGARNVDVTLDAL